MDSILIVKTSAIGDVIQTFPVLEYLRRKFPSARIDWVVEKGCAELLSAHPLLDKVIGIDTKSWRRAFFSSITRKEMLASYRELKKVSYDLLIDFQGNTKSAVMTGIASAKAKVGFGFRSVSEKPNVLVTNKRFEIPFEGDIRLRYLKLVQSYFDDSDAFVPKGISLKVTKDEEMRMNALFEQPTLSKHKKLMVCFGSKWRNKQLSEPNLIALLQKIVAHLNLSFLFIWGSAEEKKLADQLAQLFPNQSESVGSLSIPLWQALMCRVDGVLAVDSAALHLCATTAKPSFSIFGPSLAAIYKPQGAQHVAIQGSCPYNKVFDRRCPVLRTCKTGACIRDLTADDLWDRFFAWWHSILKK